MIAHSSLGISGSICSECGFELDPWDFSPLRFVVASVVHQDFSHSRRCRTTLCTDSVSSRSIRSRRVGSSGFAGWFAAFLGAPSLMFLCRLAPSSFQLVVADRWRHVLFTHWLIFVSKKKALLKWITLKPSVLFKIFVNSCSVSDNLSAAVRLEDCHHFSVCTLLHRQDWPR